MEEFFYGKQSENTEEKVGVWGAIATGVGMVTSGVTNLIASGKQGTADCGSKPTCISFSKDSDCAKRKESWIECRDTALAIQQQQVASGQAQIQSSFALEQQKVQADLEKSKRMVTIVVISAVTLAVIVIGTALIRRKRRSA